VWVVVGRGHTSSILAGSLMAGLFVVATSAHPALAAGPINLNLTDFGRILVDPATSHVFVSSPADSSIVVLDFSGNIVKTITGESGADAMVVVGSTLYVTLDTASGGIDRIDTGTLTETSPLTMGLVQPNDLTYAGGMLWTTSGACQNYVTQLVRVDPSASINPTTFFPAAFTGTQLSYCASFATNHANNPTFLLAWCPDLTPTQVTTFDVSSGSPVTLQSKTVIPAQTVTDAVINPDGTHFVATNNGSVQAEFDEFNLSDLTPNGIVYPPYAYYSSGADAVDVTTASGGILVGGMRGDAGLGYPNVTEYQVDNVSGDLTSVDFGSNAVPPRGVAIDPDGSVAFVISVDPTTARTPLFNLVPLRPPPPTGAPGPPTQVTATAGVGSATVSWVAPTSQGDSAITAFTLHSSMGATVVAGPTATSALLVGLSAVAHYFYVTATNSTGVSVNSEISNVVTPFDGGTYNALNPSRILDTRTGNGGYPLHRVATGGTVQLQVTGRGGVPAIGVSAVVMNVTATSPTGAGFVTVYPQGLRRPLSSNLNFVAGQTVPNLVEVAVGQGGVVDLYVGGSSANLVADVEGWVGDSTDSYSRNGLFQPLSPARILDTRKGTGAAKAKLGAGHSLTLQVGGRGGVPATGASAVVMNLTVTNPTQSGFLTIYPTGSSQPLASNLNFVAGQTVANRVMLGVGTGEQLTIFNSKGSVDVIADVNGWFTDASTYAGGSSYIPTIPTRIIDTRTGLGKLRPGSFIHVSYWPSTIYTAVTENVTAANPSSVGFLTLYPDNDQTGPPPVSSDLNYTTHRTVPNLAVIRIGLNIAYYIYNGGGTTNVVVDFEGYYSLVSNAPPLNALVLNINERAINSGPRSLMLVPRAARDRTSS